MEKKSLYIYKLDEQGNKVRFPNSDMPAKLGEYTYSAQRMAGTPTLTATLDYPACLDDEWSGEEFVEFRGEKYYVDQIPTSSKDNKSIMYKHELQFVSERIVLENVYFMDVVTSDADTYHSNSTSVKFMGDIHEFVSRLNASMTKSGIGYSVVIDDDITSDSKLVSLDSVYLADALQSIYTIYDLPYYFVGKVCHIGYTENVIPTPFEYRKGLVSIKKTNANYKIVNRVAGVGSTDNIPFYYPNDTQYGDIGFNVSGFDKSAIRSIDYRLLKSNIPNFLAKTLTWNIKNVSITWGERTGRIPFKEGEHIGKFISTCRLFASKGDSFTLLPKLTVSDGEYAGINHVVYVDGVALPHSNDRYNINVELSGHTYSIKIEWEVTIAEASGAGRSVSDVSEIQGSESRKGWIYEDLGNSKFVKSSDIGIYLRDEALLSTGDTISFTKDKYIEPSRALMPSIYRQSGGAERFYNAINNTYKIPGTNDYYSFKNIYSAKNVKEIKVDFSHIKPTIEGVVNASGQLFGEIADIAFDTNDSDELGTGSGKNVFDGTDEYVHSYFYVKLHIYNGDYGFNLFEQGLEGGTAVINMTTGNCAACEFEIGVTYKDDRKRAYNPVLVDSTGALIPGDFEQKVTSNTSQYVERQQDTSRNEVWIAVKKDNKSFGVVMPNATNNYKPSIGDKFVITGIKMPKPIILAAEKRLEEALIKYMSENNDEKFTFSINFSRVFLADNSHLSDVLNENARIYIKYNSREYFMYVSSFTCRADKNCLYDISVELTDKLSANVSALRSTITSIAGDIIGEKLSNTSTSDIVAKSSRHFLSKTRSDRTEHSLGIGEDLTVDGNATIGKDLMVMEILRALLKIETASLNVSGNSKTSTLDVAGKATARDVEVANQVTSLNAVIRALATIHNLTVENTADIMHGIIRQYLSSDKFVSGFLGEGFKVWKDASGLWRGELDMLTVRKVFTVFELVVQKVVHQGGMVIRSAAGGKITKVTDGGSYWRCEHDSSDDFVKDDQVLCQVFTGLKMKRYWRLVTSAGAGYFNLSKTDCEAGSATPEVGDDVAVLGNCTNAARQSAQIDCAVGANAPYRDDYAGINSYSLTGKLVTRTGNLSGIVDPDFGALSGYGLYSLNAYLKGMLRLTSGKTVETAIGEARSGAISAAASDAQAKANAAKAAAISAAASDAQAKATLAETNAKTHAQAIFDGLRIGGRNYVILSKLQSWIAATSVPVITDTDVNVMLKVDGTTNQQLVIRVKGYIPDAGAYYTVSGYMTLGGRPIKNADFIVKRANYALSTDNFFVDDATGYFECTHKYNGSDPWLLNAKLTAATGTPVKISKFKFEKGTKATDWTPAPEDVEAGIAFEINKVRTDFQVLDGQVTSKIAEINVKTQQAVSAAETAKANADASAAKLVAVTQKESNINQTAADIDLKAKRAEQAAGKAEAAEARVNVAADGVVVSAAKQAAQLAVDGVRIGGRNLVLNSARVVTGTTRYELSKSKQQLKGKTLTISFEYEYSGVSTGSVYNKARFGAELQTDMEGGGKDYHWAWVNLPLNSTGLSGRGRRESTVTIPANATDDRDYTYLYEQVAGGSVKMWNFKIEEGTKATDWSPAPEDVEADAQAKADAAKQAAISDAAAKYPTKTEYSAQLAVLNNSISSKVSQTDFSALGTRMSAAEQKITPGAINMVVKEQITTAVDGVQADIALRPTKEEIKAGISMTSGGINVFGKEISLAGKVTFASLDSSTQATINGKATTASLTALQNRLGAMAYQNMVSLAKLDKTIVQGGYIKTSLIEARSITADKIAAGAITADKLDVGSVQAAIVTADAVNALNITAKKIQSAQGTFDRIEGVSGQDSMLLIPNMIRFKNPHTEVCFGADASPLSSGGRMATSMRIDVNRVLGSYELRANTGLHLSVEGAKSYDDWVESGNHALFIPKGRICGMRLRARRVGANTTLSVMDSIVFVVEAGATVTLPGSGVEDGQIYFIRNHCGGRCRIAGDNIRAWNDGGVGNSFEVNRGNMAILMYDATNNEWTANWTGNW